MRMSVITLAMAVVLGIGTLHGSAAVPPIINYQGKLTGANAIPVADGTYALHFAIYDVPTGGTPLWSETNATVLVQDGLFSVLLGSVINLPANIFDSPERFFGVTVGTDPEMTPRQQIASVPFAVKAGSADTALLAGTAETVKDGAITTAKLADGAVTPDKLAAGEIMANNLLLPSRACIEKNGARWHLFYTPDFSYWTEAANGGTISRGGEGVGIDSGAGKAALVSTTWSPVGQRQYDAPSRFIVRWRTSTTGPGYKALIRTGTLGYDDPDLTGTGGPYRGAGFKQVDNVLYAYWDDGSGAGQRLTEITRIDGPWVRFVGEVERTDTRLNFYLNGRLKCSADIPANAIDDFPFGRISLISQNAATSGILDVSWVMKLGWGT